MRWIGLVAVLIIGTALVLADSQLARTDKLQRFEQPGEVTYADRSTHYVGLLERRSWVLRRHNEYEIYTGRYPEMGYGHFVSFDWTGSERPVIRDADWRPDGVRVRFESGHEIFVPADAFMFGR